MKLAMLKSLSKNANEFLDRFILFNKTVHEYTKYVFFFTCYTNVLTSDEKPMTNRPMFNLQIFLQTIF